MRVAITGTPGTGKTSVSKHLDREIISVKDFAESRGLGEPGKEFKVDVKAVKKHLPEECWIEGHLSHKMDPDYCIVLRTRPDTLKERLEARDYRREKIEENLEAEKMDLILSEASTACESVYEIDTTNRDAKEVAEEVEEAFSENKTRMGVVDWTGFI